MVDNALPRHRLPVCRAVALAVIWAEELKQHKFTARQRTLRSGPPSKNTYPVTWAAQLPSSSQSSSQWARQWTPDRRLPVGRRG